MTGEVRALALHEGEASARIADQAALAGGRVLLVGGWVRDRLLGRSAGDLDMEIHGLDRDRVVALLGKFGEVLEVGRSFDVLRIKGIDADISIAAGSRIEPGGRIAEESIRSAARRRDLNINSIAFDPVAGEILDPLGGRADLARGVLRASDPERFGEDPLRALRVARFRALLDFEVRPELVDLCRRQDLESVAPERVFDEFRRIFLNADRPSLALAFLEQTGLLRFIPECAALVDVPQDPRHHPEGCVWSHTLRVVDEAARLRVGDAAADLVLLFAALCHDFGKPQTTESDGDRVHAHGHECVGGEISEGFLARMAAPHALREKVRVLVENHLAPAQLVAQGAKPGAYRRLSRRTGRAGVSLGLLARFARADQLGRTTQEAPRRSCEIIDRFEERVGGLQLTLHAPRALVKGGDVLARGILAGREVGRILECCCEIQDESGLTDPVEILDRALAMGSAEARRRGTLP